MELIEEEKNTMEKIRVNVQWCDKNFGASLGDNVPGAVVLTAKTYQELLKTDAPAKLIQIAAEQRNLLAA